MVEWHFTFIKLGWKNWWFFLYEEDWVGAAKDMVKEMMLKGVNLYLPTDVVIADKFSNMPIINYVLPMIFRITG